MKIACVGDCGIDQYQPSGEILPGGITANFTRQARRSFKPNDQIHIISMMANDGEAAATARTAVDIEGIECHFQHIDGTTPVQYIKIDDHGEKDFFKYDRGLLKNFKLNEDQLDVIKSADLVMTPTYWQIYNVFDIVMAAPMSGTLAVDFSDFATDPNFELLNKYIKQIDICFFGLSKNQTELIDKISSMAKKHNKLMIITLGADGSIAYMGDKYYHCAAKKVSKIVDTTGAGDAFAAGFLSRYMHKNSIDDALAQGAINAAETIRFMGSVPS